MYYGSGTVVRIASRQPAYADAYGWTLPLHSPDGSNFLHKMTSWPPFENRTSYHKSRQEWAFLWINSCAKSPVGWIYVRSHKVINASMLQILTQHK